MKKLFDFKTNQENAVYLLGTDNWCHIYKIPYSQK